MINNITAQQAYEWLSTGQAVLIDVREPDEFTDEHISYALSLPLSNLEAGFETLSFPKDKKILFQCLKGARGESACVLINGKKECANDIYNIEGGITAWKETKLPLVKTLKKTGLSIFRQVQIVVGGMVFFMVLIGFMGVGVAFAIAGILGFALFFAGITGWCGLAMLLSKMPWNK